MTKQIKDIDGDILEGLEAGLSTTEIAQATGCSTHTIYDHLASLKAHGHVTRIKQGVYKVNRNGNGNGATKPEYPPTPPPAIANGNGHKLPESNMRRVTLPEYMRTRNPITLYVEHSPTEVEQVMRVELQISGVWLPLPITADMRICVGEDIPRWSATQEIYNGVTAFRLTYRNGDQCDYAHNPKVPLTVDVK